MDVKRRIPHEGARNTEDGLPDSLKVTDGSDTEGHVRAIPDDAGAGPESTSVTDAGPEGVSVAEDTEGHRVPPSLTVNPGTGGDFAPRRPSTGGEFIDENDVEGHVVTDGLTVSPGTGGDFAPRRPSTGGEFIDETDVEGQLK
jgi:hypothetical protein